MSIPSDPLPSIAEPPESICNSRGWLAFSIMFGTVLPVVCLAVDPFVFRSSDALIKPVGSPLLVSIRVVGYSAIALGIASLLIWLVLRRPAALMTGLLAGGAVFAYCLGVVLLPFSLVAFLQVGPLGLVPFATVWVFARHALAARSAAACQRTAHVWMVVGFLIACGLPWTLQKLTWSAFKSAKGLAVSTDPGEVERGLDQLIRLSFVIHPDYLVFAYHKEEDAACRKALAEAYRRVTGDTIPKKLTILQD
jgi:hypothetical protein